jgi:hypothetical protein
LATIPGTIVLKGSPDTGVLFFAEHTPTLAPAAGTIYVVVTQWIPEVIQWTEASDLEAVRSSCFT